MSIYNSGHRANISASLFIISNLKLKVIDLMEPTLTYLTLYQYLSTHLLIFISTPPALHANNIIYGLSFTHLVCGISIRCSISYGILCILVVEVLVFWLCWFTKVLKKFLVKFIKKEQQQQQKNQIFDSIKIYWDNSFYHYGFGVIFDVFIFANGCWFSTHHMLCCHTSNNKLNSQKLKKRYMYV